MNFRDLLVKRSLKGTEPAATVYNLRPHERRRVRMMGDARLATSEQTWRESKDGAQSDARCVDAVEEAEEVRSVRANQSDEDGRDVESNVSYETDNAEEDEVVDNGD